MDRQTQENRSRFREALAAEKSVPGKAAYAPAFSDHADTKDALVGAWERMVSKWDIESVITSAEKHARDPRVPKGLVSAAAGEFVSQSWNAKMQLGVLGETVILQFRYAAGQKPGVQEMRETFGLSRGEVHPYGPSRIGRRGFCTAVITKSAGDRLEKSGHPGVVQIYPNVQLSPFKGP